MSFYKKLFCFYSPSFFKECCRDEGLLFFLFVFILHLLLVLLISPFLILAFPFVYLNEKSKSWFK